MIRQAPEMPQLHLAAETFNDKEKASAVQGEGFQDTQKGTNS